MKKFLIITGMLLIFILLISWFLLSAYDAVKWKPQPVDKQRLVKVLDEIDRAIEKDDGKIDFNKISSRDDWDKFCIVVAYISPEKEFINDTNLIRKIFPEQNDDMFGLGVLFVKDKKIIDHMHIPRTSIPVSMDIGKNVEAILQVSRNGNVFIPRLSPNHSGDLPAQATCYERKYTIKIHKNWEYTIVRRKNSND
tara:strand:- start:114 stop:698 length:585 start_codon:yes stop_codon:yes gene_type:complete